MKKTIILLFFLPLFCFSQSWNDGTQETLPKDWKTSVSLGEIDGAINLRKFGKNSDIDTDSDPETIWEQGGLKVWQTVEQTVNISSSSANDIPGGSGMDSILIQGIDANYNFQSEIIALNGTSTVTTTLQYLNVYRARGIGGNDANAGTVSATYSTTGDPAFGIPPGDGQTQIAFYSIEAGKKAILYSLNISSYRQGNNVIDVVLFVRDQNGGGFRVYGEYGAIGAGSSTSLIEFEPPIIFDEKTDLELQVVSVTQNNSSISAELNMIILDK